MGTITGIGDIDPMRWPNSHWRSLKVHTLQCYIWQLESCYLWQVLEFPTGPMTIFVMSSSCLSDDLQVGWDESTAGEKQRRVSLWEIEPLTAPFLLCPPIALRSKRPRGFQG
jgi:hypothetical protein